MKKLKIFLLSLILVLSFSTGLKAEFFSDVIVTSPNGIWTDSRAYATLNAAITAVGASQRTVTIVNTQVVAALTVPANVTLKFERDGSIANTGQLTINTLNIIADKHQIFTGAGDIDFAQGTTIKSSWFADIETAITLTSDDTVTLLITKQETVSTNQTVGNNVTLKWNSQLMLGAASGVTLSNIGQVEAGLFQIFSGAGNFRFRDGTVLNLSWFNNLRTAIKHASTNKLTLIVQGTHTVDLSDSIPATLTTKLVQGGILSISPGITLTYANSRLIDIGSYDHDPFAGTGSITITGGLTYTPATSLTALVLKGIGTGYGFATAAEIITGTTTDKFIAPDQLALSNYTHYEIDALAQYGSGTSFTKATIDAALTAIGIVNKVTLLLRPGTWVIDVDANWSTYTNVTFKIVPGALLQVANGVTVTIPSLDGNGLHKRFDLVGTGAVVFSSGSLSSAYPEWFGIDGTADDVQINAALNSYNNVELQGKRYYIAAPIFLQSNNTLAGKGEDVTYLDYSGAAVGNQTGKMQILNKNNVTVKGFTIDCQSANGTISTGSGLVVDDGSTNVHISNVHIYDCYRHALIINTGSNIHVSKFKASLGCTSSAVLVGQFPAAYGLTTNKDCTDIFFDDVLLTDILSDGFGIWNCSGGDGFASICQRINTNNLVVKKWALGGAIGYAYWGSGITTATQDVNLTNFSFDNYGASVNQGRGLHIENGERWNHSNGTIYHLITSGADDRLGYAITLAGGNNLTYSNISMSYVGIGVLCAGGSYAKFNNIKVKYPKYVAYYVGGQDLRFDNCSGSTTGAYTTIQATWLIFAEAPATVEDVFLNNCGGNVSTPIGTGYGISVTATAMTSLYINNFKTNNTSGINPSDKHASIHGHTLSVKLKESVTAATDYELPIISPVGRIFILNAYLQFGSAIAQNNTDYNTYKLYRRAANGGTQTALTTAGLLTKTADFSTAFVSSPFTIDTIAAANISSAETLTLVKTHAGAGKAETEGILTIEYMTY